jgi:hypothetical protein
MGAFIQLNTKQQQSKPAEFGGSFLSCHIFLLRRRRSSSSSTFDSLLSATSATQAFIKPITGDLLSAESNPEPKTDHVLQTTLQLIGVVMCEIMRGSTADARHCVTWTRLRCCRRSMSMDFAARA